MTKRSRVGVIDDRSVSRPPKEYGPSPKGEKPPEKRRLAPVVLKAMVDRIVHRGEQDEQKQAG